MAVLGATNLTGCNSIPDFIATGSLMLFQQTSAPSGWTKQTSHDNKALRVVTGTATPGGSTAFTSVFASRTPAGTIAVTAGSVGNTTLTTPQIPSHTHTNGGGSNFNAASPFPSTGNVSVNSSATTGSTGGDGAHTHPFTASTAAFSGTALDFAVQYVDVIICSKN